ncbi:MAG: Crp/Fnr family transcriptional regulator [Spirochaetes bacterium]|nr:Crp/Fnr family transcriptional regulator [Spirochaetota bacterium]MBU0956572.1 Crp/Fnr family transcriptional regulator [Spirochaetota bacterium]
MNQNTVCYEGGAQIFREGEKGALMYILVKGCVELRKKVEGGEATLKVIRTPNEYFGEMALIDGRPRSATAVCTERSTLMAVDETVFESMILGNPKFALTIIKTLSARIRSSNVQISELIETIPRERVAHGLVDFALREGEKIFDGGYKVEVAAVRTWINSHLGIGLDDFDAILARYLKNETLRYAATSVTTHEHIVLPPPFISDYNRRVR